MHAQVFHQNTNAIFNILFFFFKKAGHCFVSVIYERAYLVVHFTSVNESSLKKKINTGFVNMLDAVYEETEQHPPPPPPQKKIRQRDTRVD